MVENDLADGIDLVTIGSKDFPMKFDPLGFLVIRPILATL